MRILCTTLPADTAAVEWIIANLAQVGIKAVADPVDPSAMRAELKKGAFDAALSDIDLSVPGMLAYYLGSDRGVIKDGAVVGWNYGGYANPEFDELAAASSHAFDDRQRAEILFAAQELIAGDLPMIPLSVPRLLCLHRDDRFDGWTMKDEVGMVQCTTLAALRSQ